MNGTARVSIAIPVYNGGELFRETLDSFLAQTYTDFEILISDNASTDQTEDVAREYAARDGRITYFRNEVNIGLGANHNRVFKQARGEYFKFAPADDVCSPMYLERCVEVLDRDPSVVLTYPKTQFVDVEGNPLDVQDEGWHLMSESAAERFRYAVRPRSHWANVALGLMRREALAHTRLLPSYPGGDFRMLAELSLIGKFYEIPEYLFMRRLHERSSSQHTRDLTWETGYWTGHNQKLAWPFLQLKMDHFRTLMRAPLTASEKISVAMWLLRSIAGGGKTMFRELQEHMAPYPRGRAF